MAAADPAGSGTNVTVRPWETRALEGALVVVGVLVLALGGFLAARPDQFSSDTRTDATNVGPVTLAHLTTLGTTPTVVTEVTVATSSVNSKVRSSPTEAWLGTIFGIGAVMVLTGVLYRRVTSVSGPGFSIALQGVVDDPATQNLVADAVAAQNPATAKDAALLAANAMGKLAAIVAKRQVVEVATAPTPPGVRSRLSGIAARVTRQQPATTAAAAPVAVGGPPTPDEVTLAVRQALDDLAATPGAEQAPGE